MFKVEFREIVNPVGLHELNPSLETVFTYPFKSASLKYDVRKLSKAVFSEFQEFQELREELTAKYCKENIAMVSGKEIKTPYKVIKKEDEDDEISVQFDILEEKRKNLNKDLETLLNKEIELNAKKISLKALENEGDTSTIDMTFLEEFIIDDRDR